ncbi:cellulase family glycosylhydrolase [Reichenbachiella sp.]|uniref:glycoside hydrolase 5 family protein n=1 Tax=Reichenbachiella sp. TaxID=2184521 RepID=UPI00329A6FA4
MNKQYLTYLIFWISCQALFAQTSSNFVTVKDKNFELRGKPYKYIGTNLWYGMNLGASGTSGNRERLVQELNQLQQLGLTNLRIMASSEGVDGSYQNTLALQTAPGQYNDEMLAGLDFLLSEMGKRNMKAVVCLGNFWMWSGGFAQYVSWVDGTKTPYPEIEDGGTWDPFIQYAQSFYTNPKAMQMYYDHIEFIINRTNTITGKKYKEDPVIMAWQLSNEPRGYDSVKEYRKWVKKSARFIKSMDKNHLVSIGSEGNASNPRAGIDLYRDNKSRHIDYCTTHIWIQNWSWYQPEKAETFDQAVKKTFKYIEDQKAKAQKLNKPMVIEEFGVSRDEGIFEPSASINFRDRYFEILFKKVVDEIDANSAIQGCNFWSWGGNEKPNSPGGFWQKGDPLIGDPAHERQGWYSIYNTDKSTLKIIEEYTAKLQSKLLQ